MKRSTVMASLIAVIITSASLLSACSGDEKQVSTGSPTTTSEATTTSTVSCDAADATADAKTGGTTVAEPSLLTAVRTGRQPCSDRVTFEFRDGSPPEYRIEYESGPFTFGESGLPLTIQGNAFLVVAFPHASGVDLSEPAAPVTYTGPDSIIPDGLAHVAEVRKLEDFEAVLQWVIGLDSTRPFTVRVLDGPPRVYIDFS
jgi:hypothetical protein